jgi:hypothetical protein
LPQLILTVDGAVDYVTLQLATAIGNAGRATNTGEKKPARLGNRDEAGGKISIHPVQNRRANLARHRPVGQRYQP